MTAKASGRVREDDLGTIFEEAQVKIRRSEFETVADKYCISGGAVFKSHLLWGPSYCRRGAMAALGGFSKASEASVRMLRSAWGDVRLTNYSRY